MDHDKHFKVMVNYGKATPSVFRSDEVTFFEARSMVDMAQNTRGVIMVDTRDRIAQVCQEPKEPFEGEKDWEYVPRVLPDWMRETGMEEVVEKFAHALATAQDGRKKLEDIGGTLVMVVDASKRVLKQADSEDAQALQIAELDQVLASIGADTFMRDLLLLTITKELYRR